jgi:hypothetical protein
MPSLTSRDDGAATVSASAGRREAMPTTSRTKSVARNGKGSVRDGKGRRVAATAAGREVLIERVLSEVQKALDETRTRTQDVALPPLSTVTLTLQTVVTKSAGGKFKILIFSFGKKWEKERAQELVFQLKPSANIRSIDALGQSLAEGLTDALVSAAQGVKNARNAQPPLELQEFKAVVSFVVTETDGVGAEFKIEPVSIELGSDIKTKALHKIELHFKR